MNHSAIDHHHDPLQPHTHDPNPEPPSPDPDFTFITPEGETERITLSLLEQLPPTHVGGCYIVSTGHGTSGPFTFTGARLLDLIESRLDGSAAWSQVEVISADGFGNRVSREELLRPDPAGPILLSYGLDGRKMTRQEGLIRMVVPSEKDDALRQVKWVDTIRLL